MTIRESILTLILCTLTAFQLQKLGTEVNVNVEFRKKIVVALNLLESKKAGLKAVINLNSFGVYRDAIAITALDEEGLSKVNGADGGGIRIADDGRFEILVNEELEGHGLAHTLAHEAQHIKDEEESHHVLSQIPKLETSIQAATQLIYNGKIKEALSSHGRETLFVLYSLYCTEMRAYTLNEELERDGLISINQIVKRKGMSKYIEQAYIQRYGLKFEKDSFAIVEKRCKESSSFTDYQKMLVGMLYPDLHFPKDRDPSSIAVFQNQGKFLNLLGLQVSESQ